MNEFVVMYNCNIVIHFAGHKFCTMYQTKPENGGSSIWRKFYFITIGIFGNDKCYGADAEWLPFSSPLRRFAQHVF